MNITFSRDISDEEHPTKIKRQHMDSETSTQTTIRPSIDYTNGVHDRY